MKTRTYFAFRIDIWDDTGNSILEQIAGVDDFEVAVTTYRAAVARWPRARITAPPDGRATALNAELVCIGPRYVGRRGFNEQMFGADKQVSGRRRRHLGSVRPCVLQ